MNKSIDQYNDLNAAPAADLISMTNRYKAQSGEAKSIVIGLLCGMILVLAGVFVYDKFFKKEPLPFPPQPMMPQPGIPDQSIVNQYSNERIPHNSTVNPDESVAQSMDSTAMPAPSEPMVNQSDKTQPISQEEVLLMQKSMNRKDNEISRLLVEIAVTKMIKGKLSDAEIDLQSAKRFNPNNSDIYYNLAIIRLRQGKKSEALRELENCFSTGFSEFSAMDQDKDWGSFRNDPQFIALMKKYRPGY